MKTLKIFFALSLLTILDACVPAVMVGGGVVIGNAAMQERSVGNAVDDTAVWTRVKNALFADIESRDAFLKIGVKVLEGRVLLTGTVTHPEDRVKILRIVWEQRGVREVINEITLEDNSGKTIMEIAADSWITAQIKSKILLNTETKSINYSVETINKVVYLIGIAQNENELDIVTNIAGTIKDVARVVSYVRIKDSQVRQQMLKTQR